MRSSIRSVERHALHAILISALLVFVSDATAVVDIESPDPTICKSGVSPDLEEGTTPTLPGRWANPEKLGTGWDVMYTSDNQSFMMIWYTYGPDRRPTWLTTESNRIDPATGLWRANLLRSTWNTSLQRDDKTVVGSVAVQFIANNPNQMALNWQWNAFPAAGVQKECLHDFARGTNTPSMAGRGVNSSFSGAWYEPQLGGWGDQLTVVPFGQEARIAYYFESHAVAVYDTANNPVWVQGGRGAPALPDGTPAPFDMSALELSLTYPRVDPGIESPLPVGDCTVFAACIINEPDVAKLTRSYVNTNYGYLRLQFDPASQVDIPVKIAWNRPATGTGTVVINKLTNENQILIDRSKCNAVVGLPGHANELGCEVNVDWGSGLAAARAYRVDLVTGVAVPLSTAEGSNIGESLQWLPAGSRVQFELRSSASAGYTVLSRTTEFRAIYNVGTYSPGAPPSVTVSTPSAAEVAASNIVGATAGAFRVDEAGSATYDVAISLPAGTGGLTPALAIRYNSAARDGALGPGWQLSGPMMVTRCRAAREFGDAPTIADANVQFFPMVNFSANDQFCLDGQRLIYDPPATKPAAHGTDGAEYRTELDRFTRVKIEGIASGSPLAFKLEGKDGTVRRLGSTAAGRLQSSYATAPGSVVVGWAEDRVDDSTGANRIDYLYEQDIVNGEQLLKSISYDGGNTKVDLTYGRTRTGGSDAQYTSGVPVTRTKLLTKVAVTARYKTAKGEWQTQTLREYNFGYGTFANNAKRDRLTSIQECVGTACLPATTFSWSPEPSLSAGQRTSSAASGCNDANPGKIFCKLVTYRYGDVNGDGRTDIVWLKRLNDNDEYEVRVAYSRPDASGLRFVDVGSTIQVKRGNIPSVAFEADRAIHVFDLDGDGRDDIVYADTASNSWMLRLADKSVQNSPAPFGNAINLNLPLGGAVNATLADFSGDGLPDLLTTSFSSGGIYGLSIAFLARADASSPYRFGTPQHVSLRSRNGTGCGPIAFSRFSSERTEAIDIDGDGRSELQVQSLWQNCGGSLTATPPFEVQSTRTFETAIAADDSVFVGFFRLEKVGSAYHFNLGRDFEVRVDDNDISYFRTGDINGDGLTDIVYRESTGDHHWRFSLNNGRGFNASKCVFPAATGTSCRSGSGIDDRLLQLLDFDADGRLDVWISRGTTNAAGERQYDAYLWDGGAFSATATPTPFLAYESFRDWRRSFADLDGDGRLDNLLIKPFVTDSVSGDGTWHAVRSNLPYRAPNMIERIEDGLGAQTQITYAPMTFSSVYRRDLNAVSQVSWRGSRVFDVAMPGYVVRRVEASAPSVNNNADGTGESTCVVAPATGAEDACVAGVSYRYRGLKMQAGGRGSLGFRKVYSLDLQNLIETETTFAQAFPLAGSPTATVARRLLGTVEPADRCQGSTGVVAAPDSFDCMKYVGEAAACAVGSACEDAVLLPELSRQTSEWRWRRSGNGAGLVDNPAPSPGRADTLFVFRTQSVTQKREVPITSTPMPIHAGEKLDFISYDTFGNLTTAESRTYDGDPLAASAIQIVKTTSVFTNNVDKWHLARLTSTTVKTTRASEVTERQTSFEYDSNNGQLLWERLQPLATDATQRLKTRYHRDTYGNVIRKITCSDDLSDVACEQSTIANVAFEIDDVSRPTYVQRVIETTYDADDPRYPRSVSEPFAAGCTAAGSCETERVQLRDGYGNALLKSLLNGRTTESTFGTLGRAFRAKDNAGGDVVTLLRWCAGTKGAALPGAMAVACPAGAAYRTEVRTAGAPTAWSYHDRLGRTRFSQIQGLQSTEFRTTQVDYDWLGRVSRQSEPFMATGPAAASPVTPSGTVYWTRTWYDLFGRSIQTQHPQHTTSYASRTNVTYLGLTTVSLAPANNAPKAMPNGADGFGTPVRQRTEERRNALGEITGIVEHNGHYATYEYTPTGELKAIVRRASTAAGAAELARSKLMIDSMGRKTGTVDDSLDDFNGVWRYKYNALGEVVEQQSPRGAKTTIRYDARGRPFRRIDELAGACPTAAIASETQWDYDTAIRGMGQLALTVKNTCGVQKYRRTPTYDDVGRVRSEDTAVTRYNGVVAIYTDSVVYDGYGRVFQKFFQVSGDGMPTTGEEYTYADTGYLREMSDAYRYLPNVKGRLYWRLLTMDARGNATGEELSANATVKITRGFATDNGLPNSVVVSNAIQNLAINYDAVGNVVEKVEGTALARRETFAYDGMQRLTSSTQWNYTTGTTMLSQSYDVMGNIAAMTRNGSVLSYTYGTKPAACAITPGPNAVSIDGNVVSCYDADGNQISTSLGRNVSYNAHGLPSRIAYSRSNRKAEFDYGPARERLIRLDYLGATSTAPAKEIHDLGVVEVTRDFATKGVEVKRYVGSLIIVQTRQTDISATALRRDYIFTDHQGSTHRVTDDFGTARAPGSRHSFDAFGMRRNPDTFVALPEAERWNFDTAGTTLHGYTGHDQVDGLDIIHMNGRLYDPRTNRFIQSDPTIMDAFSPQGLNSYSYAFNNPLRFTDPTGGWGRSEQSALKGVATIALSIWISDYSGLSGGWAAFTAGAATGAVQGGTAKDALRGGFEALAFYGIGTAGLGPGGDFLATSTAGGVFEHLNGGNFGHGFVTAAIGTAIAPGARASQSKLAGTIGVALIGGTLSHISGGNFANGAATSAFAHAASRSLRKGTMARPATEEEMIAAASFNSETALALNTEASDFRSIRTTQSWVDGDISDDEYFRELCPACGDPTMRAIAVTGTATMAGIGVIRLAPALIAGGRYVWRNTSFDGPSSGLRHGQGRIFGVRWRGGQFGVRLDLHSYASEPGVKVLHINYGPASRSESNHIDLWKFN